MTQTVDGDAIERYIRELFVREDDALLSYPRETEAAGLPSIQVPPELGKLLALLVSVIGARRVLEIGTLGGYSAAWMARELPPDGALTSLEVSPEHAAFARGFLERAGVGDRVEIIEGPAVESLPRLLEREGGPVFDLAFIDADKQTYPTYLDWALRLVRPGGLIVGDNVLRGGAVLDPGDDEAVRGAAEFNRRAAESQRLFSHIIPNRGGRDGVLLAVVRAPE